MSTTICRKLKAICHMGILAVGGCSLAPSGEKLEAVANTIVATGISDRQSFNDKKAETLLTLPCDISIGAYYRLSNSVQQEALSMLCSGRRSGETPPPLNVLTPEPK